MSCQHPNAYYYGDTNPPTYKCPDCGLTFIREELLERLVDLGNKFRNTPIVDDDFPAQRDNFDACLGEATEYLRKKAAGESGRG